VVLAGGDKSDQTRDTQQAKTYWKEYQSPDCRTLDHLEEAYVRDHPEEIGPYLTEVFAEFARDGQTGVLLASLRTIARVKSASLVAEETGMTRQGLQKALSANGDPRPQSVNAIMPALGYRLAPQKLESYAPNKPGPVAHRFLMHRHPKKGPDTTTIR
jgi:probable addiction module antidote protein